MDKKLNIVYFSGTGGTERAAKCFESEFKSKGYETKLFHLKGTACFGYNEKAPLLLLYPVYEMNAPAHVYDWLNSIEPVDNVPTMVISVSGGGETTPNLSCRKEAISVLESKGYTVTYENMLIMPLNVFFQLNPRISKIIIEALPAKVKAFAEEIDLGVSRRTTPKAFNKLLTRYGRLEGLKVKTCGKSFIISNSCIGCGWCAKQCPTGNISILDEKPSFADKCNFCLSCIYGCSKKAIIPTKNKFAVIKQGYSLKKLEEQPAISYEETKTLTKGWLYGNFKKYISGI
ncbi:MAG: EFR1 family ferrodoxin [Oscillospiraceae bacterium]|nr:EFR1 family ferrodoxin [Oscillospiraceae bacterium]